MPVRNKRSRGKGSTRGTSSKTGDVRKDAHEVVLDLNTSFGNVRLTRTFGDGSQNGVQKFASRLLSLASDPGRRTRENTSRAMDKVLQVCDAYADSESDGSEGAQVNQASTGDEQSATAADEGAAIPARGRTAHARRQNTARRATARRGVKRSTRAARGSSNGRALVRTKGDGKANAAKTMASTAVSLLKQRSFSADNREVVIQALKIAMLMAPAPKGLLGPLMPAVRKLVVDHLEDAVNAMFDTCSKQDGAAGTFSAALLEDEEYVLSKIEQLPEQSKCSLEQARTFLVRSSDSVRPELVADGMTFCMNYHTFASSTSAIAALAQSTQTLQESAAVISAHDSGRHTGAGHQPVYDDLLRKSARCLLRAYRTHLRVRGLRVSFDKDVDGSQAAYVSSAEQTIVGRVRSSASDTYETYVHDPSAMFNKLTWQRNTLFIANHLSYVDAIAIAACVGMLCVVIGPNAAKYPLVGDLFIRNKCIPVPVDDPRSVHDTVRRRLEAGYNVLIFPESITHIGNCVISFALLPFTHRCNYQVVTHKSSSSMASRAGEWATHPLKMLMSNEPKVMELTFHEPMDNTQGQFAAECLRDKCQNMMAEALSVPIRNDITRQMVKDLTAIINKDAMQMTTAMSSDKR